MNIAFRKRLTVPEYLAWAEARAEASRTELIDGQIIPMSPERAIHNRLKFVFAKALQASVANLHLAGEVFVDGMAVPVDQTTAYEPDVIVRFGQPIENDRLTVPNPVVVVEVLSPSTAVMDKGAKLSGYFKLASVMHYLIVDPDTMTVTHHARLADGTVAASAHADGELRLDPTGLVLDLAAALGR